MRHLFVAGFDFGTSYSKVVLRDQLTNVAKVVTFGSASSGLFPSFVRVGERLLYGPDCSGGTLIISYPKLIATDAASGCARFSSLYGNALPQLGTFLQTQALDKVASLIIARYFLSILDAIHVYIAADEEWNRFDATTDPLIVQLAVPIGLNTADNACEKLMQRALAAATLLRRNAGEPSAAATVNEIQGAFAQLDAMDLRSREDLDARCITYPEVAAGVQTVLRSPNTPDGKYITMDVGAGTVDMNAFLRRPRESRHRGSGLDYWACEVRPLGFARLQLCGTHIRQQQHERSVNPLTEADLFNQLRTAIGELMKGAFRYQPNRTIGHGSPPWSHHTCAYIWGGGAEHEFYGETFLDHLRSCGVAVPDINRLPAPSDHFAIPSDVNFGRLAIAYGLSFHKANLESISLPRELKTFNDLYPSYWQEVIATEKLCTCRGNPACLRCNGLGLIRPDGSLAPEYGPVSRIPAPAQTHRRSRCQISLERCVHQYNRLDPHRSLLIERFLLLERIRQLCSRPETDNCSLVRQRANGILLYNVRRFRARVRVLKHSAKSVADGCQCLVYRQETGSYADVLIIGQAHHLENFINKDMPPRYVDLLCNIIRSERREFFLQFNDIFQPRNRFSKLPWPNRRK